MKEKRLFIGFVLVISLVTAACTFQSKLSANNLDGTAWQLLYINKSTPMSNSRLTIDFSKGEVHGSSGCNSYFGSYSTNGKEITFGPIAMTEMACMDPEGIMQQEQDYITYLSEIVTFSIEDNQLLLKKPNQNQLTFNQLTVE